ncbi:hypothetical protein Y1Q_0008157 [Alligator mississippiensis]|uniref:Uncharacterized protein n=1 Tax=Alligator mississippiensis TaxID=8496 RepID=A0A151N1F5_ALLMI|nr:hypothetical protein Y1Q_0008157 [Alligator mississippiensis]
MRFLAYALFKGSLGTPRYRSILAEDHCFSCSSTLLHEDLSEQNRSEQVILKTIQKRIQMSSKSKGKGRGNSETERRS